MRRTLQQFAVERLGIGVAPRGLQNFHKMAGDFNVKHLLERGQREFHGLIVADSFHVPNMHVVFDERLKGDGYKFDDYYSAYGLPHIQRDLRQEAAPSLREIEESWGVTTEMVEEKWFQRDTLRQQV